MSVRIAPAPASARRTSLCWVAARAWRSAAVIFLNSSRETTLASHDAVIRPDLSGHVVLLTGPVLPDVRVPTDQRIGVSVTLGKTDAPSTAELIERYALIAGQPEGPEARVREVLGRPGRSTRWCAGPRSGWCRS